MEGSEKEIVLFNRYRLKDKAGQGGQGTVYQAEDLTDGSLAAVKVTENADAVTEEDLKNFHPAGIPGVVRIREAFLSEGKLVTVMDWIRGQTLDEFMEEKAPEFKDILQIALKVVHILKELDHKGLVCTDLKPSNLMIGDEGDVTLIDTEQLYFPQKGKSGTPGFASPEQYTGKVQGVQTMIYGFGALLHWMLTGTDPAIKPFHFEPVYRKRRWRPELMALDRMIRRCTAFVPEKRCSGFEGIEKELRDCSAHRQLKRAVSGLMILVSGIVLLTGRCEKAWAEKEKEDMERTYEDCLKEAESASYPEASKLLKSAAALMPDDPESYCLFVKICDADGSLTKEELSDIEALLYTKEEDELKDDYSLLKENEDGLFIFARELGTALYFDYEGTGDRVKALPWLEMAKDQDEVCDCLYELAALDAYGTYLVEDDRWEILKKADQLAKETDDPFIKGRLLMELLAQTGDHAGELIEESSKKEVYAVLEDLQKEAGLLSDQTLKAELTGEIMTIEDDPVFK